MQDIEFIIENNSLRWSSHSPVFEASTASHKIGIYGDFLGIIHKNKVFYPEQAYNLLCSNNEDINELMSGTVGNCYIIIEDEIKTAIYCSCTSTGLFYIDHDGQTILTNSEKKIYEQYGEAENIIEDQILSHIFSHQILLRTVPETLFRNILRCPPGGYYSRHQNKGMWRLFIQKKTSQLLHAQSKNKFSQQYKSFENLLQGIISLYKHYYQDRRFILLKSGGIDSATLLAAAHSGSLPLKEIRHVPYGWTAPPEQTQAGNIARHFNYDISYLPRKTADPENLQKIGEEGLGVIIGTQYMDYLDRISGTAESTPQNSIELSGQNMDTLYSLDNYSPSSLTYGITKWSRTLRSVWKRLLLTKYVMNKKSVLRSILLKLFSPGQDHSNYNYISSMNADINEHILPFTPPSAESNSSLPESKLLPRLRRLRTKSLLTQLNAMGIKGEDIETLDVHTLNHIVRLVRWCRTPQNVPLNYYNMGKDNNVTKLIPYSEGPFVNFFIDYQLGITDTLLIKRLVNRYFKTTSGHSLEYFAKSTLTKKQIRNVLIYNLLSFALPQWLLGKLTRSKKQSPLTPPASPLNNNVELLKKIVNCKEKYLCRFIQDKISKEFVENLYDRLDKIDHNAPLSPREDMMMCRLVNLDIFLRSAMKQDTKHQKDFNQHSQSSIA